MLRFKTDIQLPGMTAMMEAPEILGFECLWGLKEIVAATRGFEDISCG